MRSRPQFQTAKKTSAMARRSKTPGLKRGRHNLPYWIGKQVARDLMGFPDPCIPLPADADEAELQRLCQENTARLEKWIADQEKENAQPGAKYNGTMLAACQVYQTHPLSRFHKVKRNTRKSYTDSLKLIERTVGSRLIRNLTVLDVQHWYDEWRKPEIAGGRERIDRAHDAVSMVKTVLRFCAAALRRPECKLLIEDLKNASSMVKFERGGAREEEMTYAQANAFIRAALTMHESAEWPADRGLYMAIGAAAQFEMLLRQKDIIGEWAPTEDEARKSKAQVAPQRFGSEFWTGYFTWERIPGWRWRMRTSKSKYRSAADYDLQKYSMLLPLLERVPHEDRHGAIVKGEQGLPAREHTYRKWFRKVARAAGIPDEVWLMDARAGGATEADDAGATIEAIRDGLTHTKSETTIRYLRRRGTKMDALADARGSHRKRQAEEGGE